MPPTNILVASTAHFLTAKADSAAADGAARDADQVLLHDLLGRHASLCHRLLHVGNGCFDHAEGALASAAGDAFPQDVSTNTAAVGSVVANNLLCMIILSD